MLTLSVVADPKFPFPQNVDYAYGIKPSPINSTRIQDTYEEFITRFYEESPDKSKARIKWDTPAQTVSEGIGYGMLIMVYMDNATNKTQEKFDKLWTYYNSFLNSNGLMHWKINGFTSVAGTNAATDAEMDVAAVLLQAHKQWSAQKYLDDARVLIDKIWNKEVNANGFLKPGDTWDSKKNPSYFSTAALESFKHAGSQDWDRVIGNSYALIKKVRNQTSGLMPDWCQENGGSTGDVFFYDAARTPWRMAWGYLWYGHSDAKDICSTIATWITSSTGGEAASVGDRYNLDGTKTSSALTSTFLGAFACAGMVDRVHQTWLNNAYKAQEAMVDVEELYFGSSLKVMYLLLLSGNMPDLWNPPAPKKYRITVQAEPAEAGTITVKPDAPEFSRGDTVTIRAAAHEQFAFTRWSGDTSSADSVLKIVVTKDIVIKAMFDKVALQFVPATTTPRMFLSPALHTEDKIRFSMPYAGEVSLGIYSLQGNLIAHPVNGYCKKGLYSLSISGVLSNGMYLVILQTASGNLSRKITIKR
jgi:hypothetical protein